MKKTYCLLILFFVCGNAGAEMTKQEKGENFFHNINKYAHNNNNEFALFLRNILMSEEEINKQHYDPLEYFNQYENKKIRKIYIYRENVFPENDSLLWGQKFLNRTHLITNPFVIERELFFMGDSIVVPYRFSESERFLRKKKFFAESGIVIGEDAESDSVDVYVYTRDLYSLKPMFTYYGSKSYALRFKDYNVGGLGGKFSLDLKTLISKKVDYLKLAYSYPDVFIRNNEAKLAYAYTPSSTTKQISFNRSLTSPYDYYLGGWGYRWDNYDDNPINISDSLAIDVFEQDYWGGYAFDVGPFTDSQLKLGLTIRYNDKSYSRDPSSEKGVGDDKLFLTSLALVRYKYYADTHVASLGKTEDIPLGYKLELISGQDIGTQRTRSYYGLKASYSVYKNGYGYFSGAFKGGTYFDRGWEKNGIDFNLLAYSELADYTIFKHRQFFAIKFRNLLNKERGLTLENEEIRGWPQDTLYGSKMVTFNYESALYPSIRILGFRMAFLIFSDFSLINDKESNSLYSKPHWGTGGGVRFKNEHFIFNEISFLTGCYPTEGLWFKIFLGPKDFYSFENFVLDKPDIVR